MTLSKRVGPSVPSLINIRYAEQLELTVNGFATKGDRTRHRLCISAAARLEDQGFAELKVADVATGAGVALGTFYVYFNDKVDIAVAVITAFIEKLYEEVRLFVRGTDDYEAIYLSNLFFVRAYSTNPGLMRCVVQLQSQEPRFREIWQPIHRRWIETVARSIRRRAPQAVSKDEQALQIAVALEGMVFNYIYNSVVTREWDGDPKPETMAELLSVIWYRGIYGHDPITP